jgi:hypothetical protein
MNEHERSFVGFLADPARRRLATLSELGERRRRDVRSLLAHDVRLEPRFSRHIIGQDAYPGPIEEMLRQRGAPPICYVISANPDLDRCQMPLRDALDAIIGIDGGSFVSCIPDRLGFYEYAEMKSSYLLSA